VTRLRPLRSRVPTALAATLALALGAVACGEDEEPGTTATEEAVTETTGSQVEEAVPAEPSDDEPEDEDDGNGQVPQTTPPPEDALRDALVSGDPSLACEEAVTDAYVSQAYGSAQGCRAAHAGKGLATDVTVVEAALQAERGRGTVRFQGGTYDGEEGKFELVLEGEVWKLDSLEVDVPAGP
jgi:hypothetical protein